MSVNVSGLIFNIQEYAIQDGPGIRTIIFFKGCPLICIWCSNPEGQEYYSELMHSKILCQKCGQCVLACNENAIFYDSNGFPVFERIICKSCEEKTCEQKCPSKAIKITGTYWQTENLYKKIKTNSLFIKKNLIKL